MIDEIRQVLRTTIGKILAILAVSASGSLGYVTEWFTDWSAGAQSQLEQVAEKNDD